MSDSQLANDRTFLAWLRTGIALFGLGFVVAKVSLIVSPGTKGISDQALYSGIGVLLVFCGAALVAVGFAQHRSVANDLRGDGETVAPAPWPRRITVGAVAIACLLAALIVVTT